MSREILLVQVGMGVDLRGQDATKACVRAIRDAIGRNYLTGIRSLVESRRGRLSVLVRLAVPEAAGKPDEASIRAELPHANVTIAIVPGGMLAPNGSADGGAMCIANAAVEVAIEEQAEAARLSL
jgi:uncharacterized protein (TIGR02058 family)